MSVDQKYLDELKALFDAERKATAEMVEEKIAKASERAAGQVVPTAAPEVAKTFDPETAIARAARYAYDHGNVRAGAQHAKTIGDYAAVKTLTESLLDNGGAMVDQEMAAGVYPGLRQRSIFFQAGPTLFQTESGQLALPYIDTAATGGWVGEAANMTETNPTFGLLQLNVKKAYGLSNVSNDLLRDSSGRADSAIRNDLLGAVGTTIDAKAIRGDGTSSAPKGLYYWANEQSNVVDTGGDSVTTQKIAERLAQAIQSVEDGVGQIMKGVWLMSNRTKWYLQGRLGSDDFPFGREMAQQGTLMGFPFFSSGNIPDNIGDASVGSEVYFVDMERLAVLMKGGLQIDSFEGGAVVVSGSVVSGIAQDTTAIRVMQRLDIGCRARGKEVFVLDDVRWKV